MYDMSWTALAWLVFTGVMVVLAARQGVKIGRARRAYKEELRTNAAKRLIHGNMMFMVVLERMARKRRLPFMILVGDEVQTVRDIVLSRGREYGISISDDGDIRYRDAPATMTIIPDNNP